MEYCCYYGRMAVDSESFRQTNGVHIYMVKENLEKTLNKAISKLDKEISILLKPMVADIKKLNKEMKQLTKRLDRFENPKPTKPPKRVKVVE